MRTTFKGKPVEVEEFNHSSDVVDSYVSSAYWVADEQELTEEELNELTEQLQSDGTMEEHWNDYMVDRAEYIYERD